MNFENELGQPVLPGFEQEFAYVQPRGHGVGQTSSQDENWFTHPDIVERTRTLFGGVIDLDPMSCEEANKVVKATVYYTAEQDGLTRPWFGNILYNPPWGGTDASAVKKRGVTKLLDAFDAGRVYNAVCVLNSNAITTSWFAPLLGFPVCIPPRRIEHWSPEGKGGSPNSGTIIIFIGFMVDVDRFADAFGDFGRIMVPYV